MTDDSEIGRRMYPSLRRDTFDTIAEDIIKEKGKRSVDRMYAKMTSEILTERSDADEARKAGWRRTHDQDVAGLRRFPGMAGRYDFQPDDPKNPGGGGWIRKREANEGLNDDSLKLASKNLGRGVKGY
ncbi:hypothetical protein SuNHUV7_30930 (plasmid) [Pseudoseohaeicola sp. NH-UV-7]|uniref:hypothetical protein n=1 Tax=Sulfitobacter sp. TBRI5 TaxID=2989732 RepID=UPI003A6D54C5